MYDMYIISNYAPAILVVVLLQFYGTYEVCSYLWTSIKGTLRGQTKIGSLWNGREWGNRVSNFFGDVLNE